MTFPPKISVNQTKVASGKQHMTTFTQHLSTSTTIPVQFSPAAVKKSPSPTTIRHAASTQWPQQRPSVARKAEEKPRQEQSGNFTFNTLRRSYVGIIRKPTPSNTNRISLDQEPTIQSSWVDIGPISRPSTLPTSTLSKPNDLHTRRRPTPGWNGRTTSTVRKASTPVIKREMLPNTGLQQLLVDANATSDLSNWASRKPKITTKPNTGTLAASLTDQSSQRSTFGPLNPDHLSLNSFTVQTQVYHPTGKAASLLTLLTLVRQFHVVHDDKANDIVTRTSFPVTSKHVSSNRVTPHNSKTKSQVCLCVCARERAFVRLCVCAYLVCEISSKLTKNYKSYRLTD